jgi:hypothetical protein
VAQQGTDLSVVAAVRFEVGRRQATQRMEGQALLIDADITPRECCRSSATRPASKSLDADTQVMSKSFGIGRIPG